MIRFYLLRLHEIRWNMLFNISVSLERNLALDVLIQDENKPQYRQINDTLINNYRENVRMS